ncbi:hypothetical protein [Streptomyces pseudoechinosporeus]
MENDNRHRRIPGPETLNQRFQLLLDVDSGEGRHTVVLTLAARRAVLIASGHGIPLVARHQHIAMSGS